MRTLVAIPCMEEVPVRFMTSLLAMRRAGSTEFTFTSNSLVYDARNKMAAEAVERGFDRVMWLDSDMTFRPDVMERLSERLDSGMQFVTGLYFKRKPPHSPVIYKEIGVRMLEEGRGAAYADTYDDYPSGGVFHVEACGMGLCMMTTDLIREVRESYGLPFSPAAGLGEDLSFCARVRELGHTIICDSAILGGHIGTRIYTEEDWHGKDTDS